MKKQSIRKLFNQLDFFFSLIPENQPIGFCETIGCLY